MPDKRLIDAGALEQLFDDECAGDCACCLYYNETTDGPGCKLIAKAPTIDAVEVVHARWVDPCINKYGHPCHHCSACRFKASQKDRNFCPSCGAKMDAKEG